MCSHGTWASLFLVGLLRSWIAVFLCTCFSISSAPPSPHPPTAWLPGMPQLFWSVSPTHPSFLLFFFPLLPHLCLFSLPPPPLPPPSSKGISSVMTKTLAGGEHMAALGRVSLLAGSSCVSLEILTITHKTSTISLFLLLKKLKGSMILGAAQ